MKVKFVIMVALMLGAFSAVCNAQDNGAVKKEPMAFSDVEVKPEYPGGDAALMMFIADNTQYPDSAKANGIYGRVFVQFVIDEKGAVTNVKVLRGVDPSLDAEAVRVVKSMPKWKPGYSGGKPVPVIYQAPINFKMDK